MQLIEKRFIPMIAFVLAVISSSLIYLSVDFVTYDIIEPVRIFAYTQLVIVCLLVFALVASMKMKIVPIAWSIIFIVGLLIFIQLAPAFLWILFNGKVVAETQMENGIMGNWLYGLLHIAVMVLGIFNVNIFKKTYLAK